MENLESKPRAGTVTPIWLAAVIVAAILFIYSFRFYFKRDGFFDDSLMFYRYASNMKHHLGISWNHDGVHTFGTTSLTWLFVLFILSFLPISPVALVNSASILTFVVALGLMTYAIWKNTKSNFLRSPGNVLLLVAVPLELNYSFLSNVTNGMDTMLSLLINAVIAITALRFAKQPIMKNALLSGVVGFLAYETRPENLICAILLPLLLWRLAARERRVDQMAWLLGTMFALVSLSALALKSYFQTPVPLAFYLKSLHGYVGYIGYTGPVEFIVIFFGFIAIYLCLIVVLMRKEDRPILVSFGIPAVLTWLYLSTVTQIMGDAARYYVPLLPYAMIPALLMLDRAMLEETELRIVPPGKRAIAVMLILFAGFSSCGGDIAMRATQKVALHLRRVSAPRLVMGATKPLPSIGWGEAILDVTHEIAAPLPAGATIAASEVGYLGAFAPEANVIDMAALNDPEFALHGFTMNSLLSRHPDVIWMPHPDYTGLVSTILSDPRFMQQYTLYAGAYDYGVAIEKNSPSQALILTNMEISWAKHYPGTKMDDYRVTAVLPAE